MPTAEMITVKITEVVQETSDIFTLRFNMDTETRPGQFIMVWVPGVDQFPMSLSYMSPQAGITFKILGEGTDHWGTDKRR